MSRTSPLILRSGHTFYNWKTHLYGDNNYTNLLSEDLKLRFYVNNVYYYLKLPISDVQMQKPQNNVAIVYNQIYIPEYLRTDKILNTFTFKFYRFKKELRNYVYIYEKKKIPLKKELILLTLQLLSDPNSYSSLNTSILKYFINMLLLGTVSILYKSNKLVYYFHNYIYLLEYLRLMDLKKNKKILKKNKNYLNTLLFDRNGLSDYIISRITLNRLFEVINYEDVRDSTYERIKLGRYFKFEKKSEVMRSLLLLDNFGKKFIYDPMMRYFKYPSYDYFEFFKLNFFRLMNIYSGQFFYKKKMSKQKVIKSGSSKPMVLLSSKYINKIGKLKNHLINIIGLQSNFSKHMNNLFIMKRSANLCMNKLGKKNTVFLSKCNKFKILSHKFIYKKKKNMVQTLKGIIIALFKLQKKNKEDTYIDINFLNKWYKMNKYKVNKTWFDSLKHKRYELKLLKDAYDTSSHYLKLLSPNQLRSLSKVLEGGILTKLISNTYLTYKYSKSVKATLTKKRYMINKVVLQKGLITSNYIKKYLKKMSFDNRNLVTNSMFILIKNLMISKNISKKFKNIIIKRVLNGKYNKLYMSILKHIVNSENIWKKNAFLSDKYNYYYLDFYQFKNLFMLKKINQRFIKLKKYYIELLLFYWDKLRWLYFSQPSRSNRSLDFSFSKTKAYNFIPRYLSTEWMFKQLTKNEYCKSSVHPSVRWIQNMNNIYEGKNNLLGDYNRYLLNDRYKLSGLASKIYDQIKICQYKEDKPDIFDIKYVPDLQDDKDMSNRYLSKRDVQSKILKPLYKKSITSTRQRLNFKYNKKRIKLFKSIRNNALLVNKILKKKGSRDLIRLFFLYHKRNKLPYKSKLKLVNNDYPRYMISTNVYDSNKLFYEEYRRKKIKSYIASVSFNIVRDLLLFYKRPLTKWSKRIIQKRTSKRLNRRQRISEEILLGKFHQRELVSIMRRYYPYLKEFLLYIHQFKARNRYNKAFHQTKQYFKRFKKKIPYPIKYKFFKRIVNNTPRGLFKYFIINLKRTKAITLLGKKKANFKKLLKYKYLNWGLIKKQIKDPLRPHYRSDRNLLIFYLYNFIMNPIKEEYPNPDLKSMKKHKKLLIEVLRESISNKKNRGNLKHRKSKNYLNNKFLSNIVDDTYTKGAMHTMDKFKVKTNKQKMKTMRPFVDMTVFKRSLLKNLIATYCRKHRIFMTKYMNTSSITSNNRALYIGNAMIQYINHLKADEKKKKEYPLVNYKKRGSQFLRRMIRLYNYKKKNKYIYTRFFINHLLRYLPHILKGNINKTISVNLEDLINLKHFNYGQYLLMLKKLTNSKRGILSNLIKKRSNEVNDIAIHNFIKILMLGAKFERKENNKFNIMKNRRATVKRNQLDPWQCFNYRSISSSMYNTYDSFKLRSRLNLLRTRYHYKKIYSFLKKNLMGSFYINVKHLVSSISKLTRSILGKAYNHTQSTLTNGNGYRKFNSYIYNSKQYFNLKYYKKINTYVIKRINRKYKYQRKSNFILRGIISKMLNGLAIKSVSSIRKLLLSYNTVNLKFFFIEMMRKKNKKQNNVSYTRIRSNTNLISNGCTMPNMGTRQTMSYTQLKLKVFRLLNHLDIIYNNIINEIIVKINRNTSKEDIHLFLVNIIYRICYVGNVLTKLMLYIINYLINNLLKNFIVFLKDRLFLNNYILLNNKINRIKLKIHAYVYYNIKTMSINNIFLKAIKNKSYITSNKKDMNLYYKFTTDQFKTKSNNCDSLSTLSKVKKFLNRDTTNYLQLNYLMEYDINNMVNTNENYLYFFSTYQHHYDYNCIFILNPKLLCDYFFYALKYKVQIYQVFGDIKEAFRDLGLLNIKFKQHYDQLLYRLMNLYLDLLIDTYYIKINHINYIELKLLLKKIEFFAWNIRYVISLVEYRNYFNLNGLHIRTSGRRSRKLRTYARMYERGKMSLNTFSDKIDYYYKPVISRFGVLGLKVFIYRDDIKITPLYQILYESLFLRFKVLRNTVLELSPKS